MLARRDRLEGIRRVISLMAVAFMVAQATPAPALSADWVAAPLQQGEFAHFARHTPGETDDFLVGTMQVCDCQPDHFFDLLITALQKVPAAVIARDPQTVTVCGHPAQHLVVTGVSNAMSQKNLDLYAFRTADALVVIEYAFVKAQPSADDESSMKAVCPQPVVSS
jgi:hypothetical protein